MSFLDFVQVKMSKYGKNSGSKLLISFSYFQKCPSQSCDPIKFLKHVAILKRMLLDSFRLSYKFCAHRYQYLFESEI